VSACPVPRHVRKNVSLTRNLLAPAQHQARSSTLLEAFLAHTIAVKEMVAMLHRLPFIFCPALLIAQITTPPAFDVASVRPTQHGGTPDGWSHSSGLRPRLAQ